MNKILILFAHPALDKSRVHRRLIRAVPDLPGITVNDLYDAYPDFDIDVAREQGLLAAHDLIILQHPFYWYSTPAIIKQWEDLVLEHGWAYGSQGAALRGKRLLSLITTGGAAAAYRHEGYNRFTVRELLAPIEQTAYLCGMEYLPPYLIQGTHRMDEDEIELEVGRYRQLLALLHAGRIDLDAARGQPSLNPSFDRAISQEVPT
ncbi:NAD(P)H-dependent oxidoreductase [Oscillochloris sp. ZM17-4]|uniref:glutathione-regulated potassium-efflux system oxidoreductase KefF n=1 Tax=Oscillochloris sp. ZM17-4 TaxID=2866714 RepID=UPI001C7323DE|nr:NAD(P)H-dependent oxidoreductase [Oscillochloris sp. ZM17-4]MBX0328136.1 NAD(P)H-dependent oxidoreductase [Oscillochloris sp. ZM17-4]